ncbi:MAG: SDR family oxidoreductase [Clostridia bacterium]|nr:SDR family oxidoreductase [Clostridia bacterium]
MDFHGQSAFITGASVGIGRAVALLLAQRGAQVSLCDINYEKLELVKKEIEEYTKDVLIFKCDVSDEECVNDCIKKTEEAFGKVDILVNNAALWRFWSPFVETPTDEWKKLLDVNIMGTVYPTKAVLPGMLERKYGRIINVASIAGVIGNANMVHYSATKGAVISMTQALAKEVSANGITVNSVAPGSVSNSSDEDIDAWQPSELSFVGRTGTDRENADLICFLASKEAAYISGENIRIDGCRKRM